VILYPVHRFSSDLPVHLEKMPAEPIIRYLPDIGPTASRIDNLWIDSDFQISEDCLNVSVEAR
jgi:hypothetical protein